MPMKNYLILFCLALLFGCDKIPSGVTETSESNYQVLGSEAPLSFKYFKGDSSFTVAIRLNPGGEVAKAWADLYSPDNDRLNKEPVILQDNGSASNGDSLKNDNVFSGRVDLAQSYPNGKYRIDYFVLSSDGITRKVAESSFNYDNNQINFPPVLSDLVMPDSVNAGEMFVFTIKVTDPNGLNDVKKVSFKFIRKENSTVSDPVDMWDDGNLEFHGDAVARDGIYSFKNSFSADVKGRTREFVFQAADRRDSLSNIISHNIYIK